MFAILFQRPHTDEWAVWRQLNGHSQSFYPTRESAQCAFIVWAQRNPGRWATTPIRIAEVGGLENMADHLEPGKVRPNARAHAKKK